MNNGYTIVVDNSIAKAHNIDYPTYFTFAQNHFEAIGKMILSDFSHKNRIIHKIYENEKEINLVIKK